jgi:hypothetical protein
MTGALNGVAVGFAVGGTGVADGRGVWVGAGVGDGFTTTVVAVGSAVATSGGAAAIAASSASTRCSRSVLPSPSK